MKTNKTIVATLAAIVTLICGAATVAAQQNGLQSTCPCPAPAAPKRKIITKKAAPKPAAVEAPHVETSAPPAPPPPPAAAGLTKQDVVDILRAMPQPIVNVPPATAAPAAPVQG